MRCFFILLDGLGDRGFDIFHGKTPLWAATTPNLDYIAKIGGTGIYHPYKIGVSLPSEIAHFLMLGYGLDEFPGRGILEALGNNIHVKKDDVVLMARLLGIREYNGRLLVIDEKPKVSDNFVKELIKTIEFVKIDGISFKLYPIKESFCIVVLSNNASGYITDSNPIFKDYPIFKVKPLKGYGDDINTIKTANALNKYILFVYKTLNKHNYKIKNNNIAIATQRPGKLKDIQDFKDRWGLRAVSISSSKLYKGLCDIIGMDSIIIDPIQDVGKDLLKKLELAYELKDYEFIHIHTKAPDEAAHKKDPILKKNIIESLDRAFDFVIHDILSKKQDLVVITADHSTPSCGQMIHSGEVVPIVFAGCGVRVDDVDRFDEISCAKGAIGLIKGHELMSMILNLMDRGRLLGLSDCEEPPFYFPGNFEPLCLKE